LPNGGGNPIAFQTLNPGVPTNIRDLYTSADNYGGESVYWHGVDVTISARLHNGFVFQGGTSTGRGVTDFCALAANLPEIYNPALTNAANNLATTPYQPSSACHVAENWLTQFRGLASYVIPKIDVLFSATIQSTPNATTGPTDTTVGSNGTALAANVTNATGTQTFNVVQPGTFYGPRVNLANLRAAKVLTFGRRKATAGVDLLNLFNSNAGLTFQQNYGNGSGYLAPLTIQTPRFVRLNVTVEF